MILDNIKKIFKKQKNLLNRNFEYPFFILPIHQQAIEKQGYIHLKNVVDIKNIQELMNVFDEVNQKFNLINPEEPYFLNTMALENKEPKRFIQEITTPIDRKSVV